MVIGDMISHTLNAQTCVSPFSSFHKSCLRLQPSSTAVHIFVDEYCLYKYLQIFVRFAAPWPRPLSDEIPVYLHRRIWSETEIHSHIISII